MITILMRGTAWFLTWLSSTARGEELVEAVTTTNSPLVKNVEEFRAARRTVPRRWRRGDAYDCKRHRAGLICGSRRLRGRPNRRSARVYGLDVCENCDSLNT